MNRHRNLHILVRTVKNAFQKIYETEPDIIRGFQIAFSERAKLRELCESQSDGLTVTLSAKLRCTVPESVLENPAGSQLKETVVTILEWVSLPYIYEAVEEVALRYPRSLELLDENAEIDETSIQNYVRGLLICYYNNRSAYPF